MKDDSISYKRLDLIEKRILDVMMNDKIAHQEITVTVPPIEKALKGVF
jgi:hypothetical protein